MTIEEAAQHLVTPGNKMSADLMASVEGEDPIRSVEKRLSQFGFNLVFNASDKTYEVKPYRPRSYR